MTGDIRLDSMIIKLIDKGEDVSIQRLARGEGQMHANYLIHREGPDAIHILAVNDDKWKAWAYDHWQLLEDTQDPSFYVLRYFEHRSAGGLQTIVSRDQFERQVAEGREHGS